MICTRVYGIDTQMSKGDNSSCVQRNKCQRGVTVTCNTKCIGDRSKHILVIVVQRATTTTTVTKPVLCSWKPRIQGEYVIHTFVP